MNEVIEGEMVLEEEASPDAEELVVTDLRAILEEYHQRRLLEAVTGPGISLCFHIIVLTLMFVFVVTKPRNREPMVEVTVVDMEPVELEPEVIEEIEIEEEEIKEDPLEPSEMIAEAPLANDPVLHDVSDEAPQTDDDLEMEEIADFVNLNSVLKTNSLLGGRMNQGRGGGNGNGMKKGGNVDKLVNDGLRWLASQQQSSGRWPCDAHPNAVSSAAVLAFLGAGHSTAQGKYKHVVEKYVDFYCKNQRPDGGYGNHGHATPFVVMAMCDALAMHPSNTKLRNFCDKAIAYALRTQHVDGGWSGGARTTSKTTKEIDVAATGWWVMALFSARLAGMRVPESAFMKAKNVLRSVYNNSYDGELVTTSHGGLEAGFRGRYTIGAYIGTILQFTGASRSDSTVKKASKEVVSLIPKANTRNYWVMYNMGMGLFQLGSSDPNWLRFKSTMLAEMQAHRRNVPAGTYWENKEAFPHKGKGGGGKKKGGKKGGAGKKDMGKEMSISGNICHWGRCGTTGMAILNLEVFRRYGDVHKAFKSTGTVAGIDMTKSSKNVENIEDVGAKGPL